MVRDTLGGDGILMLDTLGQVLKTWSAWDVWDIEKDPYISRYMYDRFHMNGFCFDTDSNYLVSVPIEDQIWKIDRNTGKCYGNLVVAVISRWIQRLISHSNIPHISIRMAI